jgi:tetratricopeptide (TPR) repeat protein
MHRSVSSSRAVVLSLALALPGALSLSSSALAAGSGTLSNAAAPPPASAAPNPKKEREQALKALEIYNEGVKVIADADAATARASTASDPRERTKYQDKARATFTNALTKFQRAVELNPNLYQAWNYIGYSSRNLGDYSGALQAYDQALTLNPTYVEAIEYRGRAYLGLGRTVEAQTAYLTLFASDRELANKLLAAMRDWVSEKRAAPGAVEPAKIEEFAKWIDERSRIAAQTAGLTPAGGGGRWQ